MHRPQTHSGPHGCFPAGPPARHPGRGIPRHKGAVGILIRKGPDKAPEADDAHRHGKAHQQQSNGADALSRGILFPVFHGVFPRDDGMAASCPDTIGFILSKESPSVYENPYPKREPEDRIILWFCEMQDVRRITCGFG